MSPKGDCQVASDALRKIYRLLIVEDDPITAGYMKHFLPCFVVESAGSYKAAVERLQKTPILHAILLDLHGLGNGDGPSMIRDLSAAYPDMPIVAITGYTDITPKEAIECGAEFLLHKPLVSPESLREVIINAMARHAADKIMKPLGDHIKEAQVLAQSTKDKLEGQFEEKPPSWKKN